MQLVIRCRFALLVLHGAAVRSFVYIPGYGIHVRMLHDLVAEVGSNDGYLLRNFVQAGIPAPSISCPASETLQ